MALKLIVGLGNPGAEYANTRHNAGFMVLDRLAGRHGLGSPKHKFHAGVLEGLVGGVRCLLMQPMTYMNRSGLAVGEAVRFYKLDPGEDLMVVTDDVALPLGRIRVRAKGSPGGHNGLADVERALGTDVYSRLRVGIDPPGRARQRDYVLGRFSGEQVEELGGVMERSCDAIEMWLCEGVEKTMSLFNAAEG